MCIKEVSRLTKFVDSRVGRVGVSGARWEGLFRPDEWYIGTSVRSSDFAKLGARAPSAPDASRRTGRIFGCC